jgi:hypothetical protein
MDDLEIKALAYVLAEQVKKYHHQQNVYFAALERLKELGVRGVDEIVAEAQTLPEIQAITDRDFAFLDEMLPTIPEIDIEEVRRQFLQKWPGSGSKPN